MESSVASILFNRPFISRILPQQLIFTGQIVLINALRYYGAAGTCRFIGKRNQLIDECEKLLKSNDNHEKETYSLAQIHLHHN